MATARLVKKQATLTLGDGVDAGPLRLAIVADTHSSPHPATLPLLRSRQPRAIIHAGDIGDLAVLEQLEEVAPVYAIRGNIDVKAPGLPDVLALDLVSGTGPDVRTIRLLVIHIGVYGPKLRSEVAQMARQEGASLVICGHSHVPFIGRDRDLVVFNPGSVGPRRFALPIVFGLMDITPAGLRLAHVDCETGKPFEPPPC